MSDLRALIREILSDEIAAMRGSLSRAPQEESVRVSSAAELTEFALSVLRRASDASFASALLEGRLSFVPQVVPIAAFASQPPAWQLPAQPATIVTTAPAALPELTRTIITERDIAGIPQGQTRLRIGKNSRLTPLAGDEARRRGIRIERSAT